MDNSQTNYLKGKCLVAAPSLDDERFEHAVVYLCAHSAQGAMGFVINHKITEFSFLDLAMQLPIRFDMSIPPPALYQGGPVDKVRGFVLHTTDYLLGDCVVTGGGVAVSSSVDILSDIAKGDGPRESIIAMGYANWAPGQLEKEIITNDWLVTSASEELVFKTKDEEKWQKALDELKIDINRLSQFSGRA
ncbi:MAG: YqgE/AlgH family protein [Alphaproteobacteria bacterium]|nr:YqgE/AlgH family protein [Alphaproteobacteria bacterium]MBQ7286097.1 YqgE/AlgH family protein [Alphaproteobacteria bacterium]